MGLFVELPTDSCNAINSDKSAIVNELILKRYVIWNLLRVFAGVVAIDADLLSRGIEEWRIKFLFIV